MIHSRTSIVRRYLQATGQTDMLPLLAVIVLTVSDRQLVLMAAAIGAESA